MDLKLLLRLTDLNSIEAEIDMRKPFLGRFIIEPKMASSVRNLVRSRTESLPDTHVKLIGILPSICEVLHKYGLFNYFKICSIVQLFLLTATGNQNKVRDRENRLWLEFCAGHPNMHVAHACLENVPPHWAWALADHSPDLVSRLHV